MPEKPTGRPDLERYADVPLFNTKAVVQQTGITAPTLRAWERRYLILSPERASNDYRLYSERDIAVIRWLKDRVDTGMSISQAVALLRHLEKEDGERERTAPLVQEPDANVEIDVPPAIYSMSSVQERLLSAFSALDETTASQLIASMLAIYPIEQLCAELITPALWEIGRRWEQGELSVTIEHFASAFFHGVLTNLFHATPINKKRPLVMICCAPGEAHELAPLMLALLLRRAGLRVAFLGQNIEIASFFQTARQLSPALICVSMTLVAFIEGVAELGQKLQHLPQPRPIFIFGGQAFEQHTDLIARVSGVYVHGDMQTIIATLRRMALDQAAAGSS
jgi:MerR family transcriptional regulator, light-induced transcriptional regulator